MRTRCVIVLLFLVGALPVMAEERVLPIEPSSELGISVKKRGAFKAFAHDHELAAPIATGTLVWDKADPANSSVSLRVKTSEIKVLDPELSEKDKAEVLASMRKDVLEVEKFPEIVFASERVVELDADKDGRPVFSVAGRLTLHGVTRAVTLKVALVEKDGQLVVTGDYPLTQTDYKIEPFSAAFGTVGVQDVVTIHMKVVAGGKK